MRFLTDDGRFGILVSPLSGERMFRFQLVVDSQLIGDSDPSIVYTAMYELGSLRHLDDPRLGLLSSQPDVVLSALLNEEFLHDATMKSVAESLDRWMIHGYVYQGDVVMVARAFDDEGSVVDPTLISVLGLDEYTAILEAARDYWSKTGGTDTRRRSR